MECLHQQSNDASYVHTFHTLITLVFSFTGASDCASCVGLFLEVARALVADPKTTLDAPLVFLFNGGEEALLLAAHGFMQHSKWATKLGAFINLESTGPGGPAYLFQHTGTSYAIPAYWGC